VPSTWASAAEAWPPRAEARPAFINSAVALAAGELVPVAGGVLVRDEACGLRGIAAAGLRADPGT